MRGMTLLETMVAVTLLGVLVAIATPSISLVLHRARVEAAAEQLAGFLDVARSEAMASKRCTRLTLPNGGRSLRVERLNSFDCDQSPETARRIDGTGIAPATTWVLIRQENLEGERSIAAFDRVPAELASAPGGGGAPEVRFRPNGRVWGRDRDLTNDDALLRVAHATRPDVLKRVLVEGNGVLCVLPAGTMPPGGPVDFGCPR